MSRGRRATFFVSAKFILPKLRPKANGYPVRHIRETDTGKEKKTKVTKCLSFRVTVAMCGK